MDILQFDLDVYRGVRCELCIVAQVKIGYAK